MSGSGWKWWSLPARYWASFSFVGLAVATIFFALALTPSLLPRHFLAEGILGGFGLAVGYGVGVLLEWLWLYLQIPVAGPRPRRVGKWITSVAVAIVAVLFLWRTTVWQNSIRELMEMEPVETAYPVRVALIAAVTGAVLIALARVVGAVWIYLDRRISRVVPRRVSRVVTTLVVGFLIVFLANGVIARLLLNIADRSFTRFQESVEEGVTRPTLDTASGSPASLVSWDHIGRFGKTFAAAGPTKEQISQFLGREARQPLRVYVGLGAKETPEERAELALQELIRVGGFERSILIVATPTGTGWLDPAAVDSVEYLHAGDTAIVATQYSHMASWITLLIDPTRSRASATALFNAVYDHWRTLPKDHRPKLYVHGLSLGALGSAGSADLFTVFEDPIQGGVWAGPPFASLVWQHVTRQRNPGSPAWLPTFRDGSMLRFTGRENTLPQHGSRWGPMRFVYIQYPSDPMTFVSPDLAWRKPEWLIGPRGPDVSPYLRWYPVVTFLQVGFDLPMATAVPPGYGHHIAAANYIDAWLEVTQPPSWNPADTPA